MLSGALFRVAGLRDLLRFWLTDDATVSFTLDDALLFCIAFFPGVGGCDFDADWAVAAFTGVEPLAGSTLRCTVGLLWLADTALSWCDWVEVAARLLRRMVLVGVVGVFATQWKWQFN